MAALAAGAPLSSSMQLCAWLSQKLVIKFQSVQLRFQESGGFCFPESLVQLYYDKLRWSNRAGKKYFFYLTVCVCFGEGKRNDKVGMDWSVLIERSRRTLDSRSLLWKTKDIFVGCFFWWTGFYVCFWEAERNDKVGIYLGGGIEGTERDGRNLLW